MISRTLFHPMMPLRIVSMRLPLKGRKYQGCYDLKTHMPFEEYVRLYEETKEKFAGMGIHFK